MLRKPSPRFVSRLTRETIALVLAGGRGSRLHELTDWRAKPAVPFGGKFRIIDFPLSNCVNSGIRRIGILTQYKAHSLIKHVTTGWGFLRGEFGEFVDLLPAQQRLEASWYEGTADAVYQNLDILRQEHVKYVLVLAGDHIYKMDYGPMLAAHAEKEADVTVGCFEIPIEIASEFGIMGVEDGGRINEFVEKPETPTPMIGKPDVALGSMGIYVFSAEYLYQQLLRDREDPESEHDFGKNIIPHAVEHHNVFAFSSVNEKTGVQNYWRDVGTIDAYWQANIELVGIAPELNLYDTEWPIWTYQTQAPPAKFVFNDEWRRGCAVDSMVSGGCIVSGAHINRSLLFTNVRVEQGSLIEEAVILPEVTIGESCSIRKAVIDRHCDIPAGTQIGMDLEEDKKRFRVTDKGVVLVTPEMLGQSYHNVR